MIKRRITLPSLLFLSFLLLATKPLSAEERSLHIFYSGEGHGEVEPCGCAEKASYGGLKRRQSFLAEARKSFSPSFLIEAGNFLGEKSEQGEAKGELLLKAMAMLGYDLVVPGEIDLSFGKGFLEKRELPILGGESPLGENSFYVKRGGVPLHVHTPGRLKEGQPQGVHLLVINGGEEDLSLLLEKHPWIDIVIDTRRDYQKAEKVGTALVVSVKTRGESLGHLAVTFDPLWKLVRYEEKQVLLDKSFEEGTSLEPFFKKYNQRVKEIFARKALEREVKKGIFVGEGACKRCHEPFWEQWNGTAHASAWASLEKSEKESDPECVPCHSVGYGLDGGYTGDERTAHLRGVQCEACHGAGGSHSDDYEERLPAVTEKRCLKCHNKQHSPDFDFEVYLPRVKH